MQDYAIQPIGRQIEEGTAVEQAPRQAPPPALTREEARGMTGRLNGALAGADRSLRFEVDEATGEFCMKVVDAKTNRVIKTVPSDALRSLNARIHAAIGVLLDSQG